MDHSEAVQLMATERYLLGELSPDQRDAFEEHFFECYECALDVRAEAAFIQEAKTQLPLMAVPAAVPVRTPVKPAKEERDWFAWVRPSWAVPTFAALLVVIGYQNLATIPGLRSAAERPRLGAWSTIHLGTRAGAHTPVTASRKDGAEIQINDLPSDGTYTSFALALEDPQGKQLWIETRKAPADGLDAMSLTLAGGGLQEGAYTLTISGITPQGSRTQLDRRILDVRFSE
ncbi:MAG TPA: zf-HC2 domain-containing protein [Acidobacteriaceae bacterium]|jgi:hypothetical protein|nr:zf-HC2 domain-containing protein [Acidobacteriaceae bacterium]